MTSGKKTSLLICFQILSLLINKNNNAFSNSSSQERTPIDTTTQTISLKKYLSKIEKLYAIKISYSDILIHSSQQIIKSELSKPLEKHEAIEAILSQTLIPLNLSWQYTNLSKKEIVITHNSRSKTQNIDSSITITGYILSEDNKPLQGASISVKNINIMTKSNASGFFSLVRIPSNSTLLISYIGFEPTEVTVTHTAMLKFHLKIAWSNLDEKIIMGYGSTSKRYTTGAISRITGETISKQPATNPILALQGTVSGVNITQSSGLPGSETFIRIRGQNSLTNNNALYIIDGVPFLPTTLTNPTIGGGAVTGLSPFSLVSPADIESIEILKDADATSIYGSRGANGVVLITTKKGKEGKVDVVLDHSSGFGKVAKELTLLNRKDYQLMREEALRNDGVDASNIDYDINGTWDTTQTTNWQKTFIGNSAKYHNTQISISGGTQKTKFVVRTGINTQGTVFPESFPNKTYSAHLSINHISENNKFAIGITTGYVNNNSTLPYADLTKYIYLAPNAPNLFLESNRLNWQNNTWTNPLAEAEKNSSTITRNLLANTTLSYKPIRNLEIKVNSGYNDILINQSIKTPLTAYAPNRSTVFGLRNNMFATSTIRTWIIEPQTNYKFNLQRSTFEVLIGGTLQSNTQTNLTQTASGFSSDDLIDNIAAASYISIMANEYNLYRYNSVFGRINFAYDGKYFVNITVRRDGSSRFGDNEKFGNFSSIGLGWVLSNESFFANSINFINFAKLRTSYGTTGIEPSSDYQYLNSYTSLPYPYLGRNGLVPVGLNNPYYKWEVVKKFEIGLDLSFIKDKISATFDYYLNRTSNQLLAYSLSTITGFNSVQANLDAVIQNSGYETEIRSTNIESRNSSWSTSFNLTIPQNKLLSFPNISSSSYSNSYTIGLPTTIRKVLHYTGINSQTGLYEFEDTDKDGQISYPNDYQSYVNYTPKLYGGLSNTINVKEFSLDFNFYFVKQTGIDYAVGTTNAPGFFNTNQLSSVLNRWTQPGEEKQVQKFTQTFADTYTSFSNLNNSDHQIDASYIRLRSLSLSYKPTIKLKKTTIKEILLYLRANNLFTITKYTGLDPEVKSPYVLPAMRLITAGIQIKL